MNHSFLYANASRFARFLAVAFFVLGSQLLVAQTDTKIKEHLDSGEFTVAINLANTMERESRNNWLAQISEIQMNSGAGGSAYDTAGMIDYDTTRSQILDELSSSQSKGPKGQGGGITEADFDPLIELIQNTINTDTWADNGGLGTIQAYPSGVFVDSTGTLKRIRLAKGSGSEELRRKAAYDSGNRNVEWESDLRKVSITRLEKAAHIRAAQGLPVDTEMMNLAGIYELKYLMVMPETGDIVIAGPAGPWVEDTDGRRINVETGKPVLQLDDLVVCLRNAWDQGGKFGCSINPRRKNLAATQNFLATTKLKGKRWSAGIQQSLGMQDIEVFGIEPNTHAARVLVEADYRMKLIGMGLEDSIPEVKSYLDRIKLNPDGSLPPMDVVRWWFTQNYDEIVTDQNRTTFSFKGTGVKVMSENEFITAQGDRVHTGKSNGPTQGFARDFTKHFEKLGSRYPVYNQLKNVFDMALVASLIRTQKLDESVQWNRTFFDLPNQRLQQGKLAYKVKTDRTAKVVDSVMNEKILKQRKRSSVVKHQLVGVSGGISYDVNVVLKNEMAVDGSLVNHYETARPTDEVIRWWWD